MKVVKIEKLEIREDTGCLTVEDDNNNHNFALASGIFVKNSSEGRGSNIETVGGNSAGFTELDDLYYFARKVFRALKYPMSRVSAGQEKREADIMFGGSATGEITRDEIKWSKFLEKQQKRISESLRDTFLIHLDMKGLTKQYNLNHRSLGIFMNKPSNYDEQMEQNLKETRYNNYGILADREEMSKYYLMKKFLKWTDDDIQENVDGLKKDKELGLTPEEEM